MRRSTRTRTLSVAVAAMVAAGVVGVASPAHAASGGGCKNGPTVGGVTTRACINANGFTVNSDGYLGGSTTGCTWTVAQVDAQHNITLAQTSGGCRSGHIVGPSLTEFVGAFETIVCVTKGSARGCVLSPQLFEPA